MIMWGFMSSAVGDDMLGTNWTRVENEAIRVIIGATKDTPTEAMRLVRDLPLMQTRETGQQQAKALRRQ